MKEQDLANEDLDLFHSQLLREHIQMMKECREF
jgi:hypothetical protein